MSRRFPKHEPRRIPTDRLEAFSDGVFAVAITLLVLDLKTPVGLSSEQQLWGALLGLAPSLITWVVSFAFILTIWINHHYFFESIKTSNRLILWINGLLLLFVAFIPYPTSLMGEYPHFHGPVTLLSGTMFGASVIFAVMRYVASFSKNTLADDVTPRQAKQALRRSALGSAIYLLALIGSFYSAPLATGLLVVALVFYIFGPPNVVR